MTLELNSKRNFDSEYYKTSLQNMVSGQEAELIILPLTAILNLIQDLKENKIDEGCHLQA